MAEDLAREVGRLYEDAEGALLERLAKALEADLESPLWAELKLAAIGNLRTAVETVAEALQQDADGKVREALITAYNRGRQAAVAEMGALDIGRELVARETLPNAPAVDRLAASMAQDTRPLYQRITRSVVDAYRRVVALASGGVILGGMTRRQASQRALDQFASRGITGFVDRAGRSWDMASYAEMAVRSVTARAAIEGHVDALTEIGVGLVIVSDAPLECPLCRQWEGEVLTLGGQSGPHTVRAEHAAPPEQPRQGILRRRGPAPAVVVHVAGSLFEARAAGLFHPNCRHSLSAYLPGVTTRPPHHATPGTTYEDTQRQREIERHIRRWKRVQAAAMDDAARRKAGAKIRAWQKAMREHVAAHEHLRRKPEREQLQTAATQRGEAADRTGPPSGDQPGDEPAEQPRANRLTEAVSGIDPNTRHGAAMQRTLAAISRVHRAPDAMPTIPLVAEDRPGYQGAYQRARMRLNPDGRYPHITAAHEMSHFLDDVLGEGNSFFTDTATEFGGVFHSWWQATSRSPVARLLSMMKRAFPDGSVLVHRVRADGTLNIVDVDHRHIDYLGSHREMFGRAYAQWIAMRSGDPQLLSDLERARDMANGEQVVQGTGQMPGYPGYWSDREFAPIAAAFDEAFRRLGLLREADDG